MLHAGGWAVGGLEIYIVVRLSGIPVDLGTSFVLEALSTAVRFATFMIPGSLGALEGGNVAAFALFGLPGRPASPSRSFDDCGKPRGR